MVSNIDPSAVSAVMAEEEKNLKVLYFKIGKLYTEKCTAPRAEISTQMLVASKKLTANLKTASENEIKTLKRLYFEIGKQYAEGVATPDDYMAELFNSAKKTAEKIKTCRKYIEISKASASKAPAPEAADKMPCPHCGKPITKGVKFCNICGKPVAATAPAPQQRVCGTCGNTDVIPEDIFCIKCGKKL